MSATDSGGPTTLVGACTSPMTLGGEDLRSMIETVSGAALGTTTFLPFSFTTLLSFAETASWA